MVELQYSLKVNKYNLKNKLIKDNAQNNSDKMATLLLMDQMVRLDLT